ncbi:hypothetical protein [Streptomyces sp. NPDC001774]
MSAVKRVLTGGALPLAAAAVLLGACLPAVAAESVYQVVSGSAPAVHPAGFAKLRATEAGAGEVMDAKSPAYVAYQVEIVNNTGRSLVVSDVWASNTFDENAPELGDTVAPGESYVYDVTWWVFGDNVSKVIFGMDGGDDQLVVGAYAISASAAIVHPDGSYNPITPQWVSGDSKWLIDVR